MNKKLEELIALDKGNGGIIAKLINYLTGKIPDEGLVDLLADVFDGDDLEAGEGEKAKVMANFIKYLRKKGKSEGEILKVLSYVYHEYEEEEEEDEEEREDFGEGVLARLIKYLQTEGLSADEILCVIAKF